MDIQTVAKSEINVLKNIGESLKINDIQIPESTTKIILDRLQVISNILENTNQEKDIDIIIFEKIIQQQNLFIQELQKELKEKNSKLDKIRIIV